MNEITITLHTPAAPAAGSDDASESVSDGPKPKRISPPCRLAVLEREAEEARFDWLEARGNLNAAMLWRTFSAKAVALENALEDMWNMSQQRRPRFHRV